MEGGEEGELREARDEGEGHSQDTRPLQDCQGTGLIVCCDLTLCFVCADYYIRVSLMTRYKAVTSDICCVSTVVLYYG